MAKAMSKSQVAATLSEKHGISKSQAAEILDSLAQLAYQEAKNTFTLPGLGKLVLVDRAARVGRNPMTGEPVNIPAKRVIKFRIAKAAKEAILNGQ
jgi:DNA-binding protein HU-beta